MANEKKELMKKYKWHEEVYAKPMSRLEYDKGKATEPDEEGFFVISRKGMSDERESWVPKKRFWAYEVE